MPDDGAVVDLWPAFASFWRTHDHLPAPEQVAEWLSVFEQINPEIHARYAAEMAGDGLDWAEELLERHWPWLPERLPRMAEAHDRLLTVFEPVAERTREVLGTDLHPVLVIIPVGYGGWATTYQGQPACDLGLDTIVELGWSGEEALRGLIAHELGHVAHFAWRQEDIADWDRGPLWRIYEEGFAQVCERLVRGADVYHIGLGEPGWLEWCRDHRAMLAREFLRRIDAGDPLYGFFGSYPECNIEGYRETGYFLGQAVVGHWLAKEELPQIAVLVEAEGITRVRNTLEHFGAESD